ncbi:MAG: DUF3592 domain-containing protein [Candidatus Competibacteraceae bacterium]|nr:DUF3592 domain-containing protein [Candidatus Competibacteraceae bacterium]
MELLTILERMVTMALAGEVRAIIALILFIAGLGSVGSFVYQLRLARWPTVSGTLLEAGEQRVGGGDLPLGERDYTDRVSYEYRVEGNRYTGYRLSPWKMVASHNARTLLRAQLGDYRAGMKVPVHYNPRNPEKSFLFAGGWLGRIFTLVVAAALLAVPFLLLPA